VATRFDTLVRIPPPTEGFLLLWFQMPAKFRQNWLETGK